MVVQACWSDQLRYYHNALCLHKAVARGKALLAFAEPGETHEPKCSPHWSLDVMVSAKDLPPCLYFYDKHVGRYSQVC